MKLSKLPYGNKTELKVKDYASPMPVNCHIGPVNISSLLAQCPHSQFCINNMYMYFIALKYPKPSPLRA